MRIKVIEAGPVSKNKTFFEFMLKYESDGKVQEKKLFSFAAAAYNALKDAKPDENYDVELQKDQNGYWQWKSVTKLAAGAASAATGTNSRGFETPEERTRRQVLIVRQSCLAQAVAYASIRPEKDIHTIIETAQSFEEWVNRE